MIRPILRFKTDDGLDFPEWESLTLGDIGHVAMCKRVYKHQTSPIGDIPFFKIKTFGGTPDAFISRSLFNELKSRYPYPKKGTILLSASGTIGKQVAFQGNDAYFQDSNIVWLEHDNTVLDSFLAQFYLTADWSKVEGSSIKRLYNKIILDTPFYRPCIEEQSKIASLLSSIDDVITKQQAEIEAWEQRKKGVAQLLLNQEVRFKADDGSDFPDWKSKPLGELGTFQKGAPLSKSDIADQGAPFIFYGEINTTYKEVAYKIARVTDKTTDAKFLSRSGDVLIPTSAYSQENISAATCVMQDGVILAGDLLIYRHTNEVDGRILSYIINHQIKHAISRIAQGEPVLHLYKKDLTKIKASFPLDKAEQRKIADFLDKFDEVIDLAKAELEKWCELKKGLLQQLFV